MSQLKLKEIIGEGMCFYPLSSLYPVVITEGEFGIVYRGLLYQDEIPKVVAVKTLKGILHVVNARIYIIMIRIVIGGGAIK